jgi:hypothetical protein
VDTLILFVLRHYYFTLIQSYHFYFKMANLSLY